VAYMPRKRKTVDKIDLMIINFLREDGRLTDVELAKRIGVSKDTVKRRRERLIREGFIQIKALVNPFSFGYRYSYLLGIKCAPGVDIRELANRLAEIDNVIFVGLCLGPTHHIVLWARAKDQMELSYLVEDLRKNYPEIEMIDTDIIYEVVKHSYYDIKEID